MTATEGYRLWSESYDAAPNPLLALEMRILRDRLGAVRDQRVLDVGSGTGRWMNHLKAAGASVFGVDACREMVLEAERKPGLRGRSVLGDATALPIRDGAVDLAICSFTFGYIRSIEPALRELARVAKRVIVSDMHPDAVRAGWTRSFRAGDQSHELLHYEHAAAELDECARRARLRRSWRVEASFGAPERCIFQRAGKEAAFEDVCQIPAVLVTAWNRA
jgi:ubiquinone/menaquinone biosynthesis C-methylase UbiE